MYLTSITLLKKILKKYFHSLKTIILKIVSNIFNKFSLRLFRMKNLLFDLTSRALRNKTPKFVTILIYKLT